MNHRQASGESGEYTRRKNDGDFLGKLAELKERFWPITWLLVAFLVALGFDFKLPSQKFFELQSQINSVKADVIEGKKDREAIAYKVDMLLRIKCIENTTPGVRNPIDLRLAGVDCQKLLSQ